MHMSFNSPKNLYSSRNFHCSTAPSHALAAVLLLVAFSGTLIHLMHRRERRNVYLTHPPGSVAASTALAYHSGFGELLLPYDNDETMAHKLRSLRFGFDKRTGAIYADDLEEDAMSDESVTVERLPKSTDEKALVNPHERVVDETGGLMDPHMRTPMSATFEPYAGISSVPRAEMSARPQSRSYEYEQFDPDKKS